MYHETRTGQPSYFVLLFFSGAYSIRKGIILASKINGGQNEMFVTYRHYND